MLVKHDLMGWWGVNFVRYWYIVCLLLSWWPYPALVTHGSLIPLSKADMTPNYYQFLVRKGLDYNHAPGDILDL